MSDFDSLTKVTKQELQRAISNFTIRKEQDEVKYKQVLAEWKKGYKLSWWQRNVSKLHKLNDEDFTTATSDYYWSNLEFFIVIGQLEESVKFTVGHYRSKWKDIAFQLHCSNKEEHYVCTSVISWLNMFGAFEEDY